MKKILLLIMAAALFACAKDGADKGNGLAPVVSKIYLEDAQSSVPDREVVFARLGQTLRLEGKNLLGVSTVSINGYECLFNPTLMSDGSMVVSINAKVPVLGVDPEVKNKIVLAKLNGKSTVVSFEIRAAAPSISSISHTMPAAGDRITIKGTNLHSPTQVEFPGGKVVSEGLASDEDGTWVKVTVPEGITASGSVAVTGANGTARSPYYFNYTEGLFENFDTVKNLNTGYMPGMDAANTVDTPIPTGIVGPKSQGFYQVFNKSGNFAAGGDQRAWLNSTNMVTIMQTALAGNTSTDMFAIQMDIYVVGTWTSGMIRMAMADGSGSQRYCATYRPILVGSARTPEAFVNPGEWFTITLMLSENADYGGKTLDDVMASMNAATYKQAGPWFDNKESDNGYELVAAEQVIYFDNVRIVPLDAPSSSDYPEEDEE